MAMLFITHDLGIVRRKSRAVCVMKEGEIVEHGPWRRCSPTPQHPYTRTCCRPSRRASRPGTPPTRSFPGRRPQGLVPGQEGSSAAHRRPHQGGRRRRSHGPRGPDRGRRRRIRFGQDDARPGAPAADLLHRPDRLSRADISSLGCKAMRPLRRDMQIVFQDPYGSLSPRMSVRQIIEEGLLIHGPWR
jgi:microcin C transport system ATP-binding protein